jgi:hypothetical protein
MDTLPLRRLIMSRTWRKFGLSALLLVLVVGVSSGFGGTSDKTEAQKQYEALKKQLDDIQADLKEMKDLRNEVKSLKPLVGVDLRIKDMEEQLKQFTKRMDGLEDAVVKMDRAMRSAEQRIAKSIEPAARPVPSTIRLMNRSTVGATVILDNIPYELQPGETRTLANRQPGAFNFEVLADGFGVIRAPVSRMLNPGEMYDITINP